MYFSEIKIVIRDNCRAENLVGLSLKKAVRVAMNFVASLLSCCITIRVGPCCMLEDIVYYCCSVFTTFMFLGSK